MRQLGDRSWLGAVLLLAPRWPYAVPLLGLWPWALITRRWRAAVATGVATIVVLWLIMGFRVALPGGPARGDLRLLSCNIHRQNLDGKRLAEYIAKVEPDIVALQGWSEVHRETLFGDGRWTVKTEGELLVASRHAIRSVTLLPLEEDPGASPGERGAAAIFEMDGPKGPLRLVCLHLASPHAGLNSMWSDRGSALAANLDRRWRESRQLGDIAADVRGTLLLAGDFNINYDSPIFREHWSGFTDAFEAKGSGLGYTYLNNHTQFRIDHILADPSCGVVRCWVGPDVHAAHRPLVADVTVR